MVITDLELGASLVEKPTTQISGPASGRRLWHPSRRGLGLCLETLTWGQGSMALRLCSQSFTSPSAGFGTCS